MIKFEPNFVAIGKQCFFIYLFIFFVEKPLKFIYIYI